MSRGNGYLWVLGGAAVGVGYFLFGSSASSVITDAVISAGRTAQDILDAVAAEDPQHTEDLQPGWWPVSPGYNPTATWCNKFVARVTKRLGVPVPWGEYGTRVEDQIHYIDAGNDGWFPAANRSQAQELALQGFVVLATYDNLAIGSDGRQKPGHIALVLPYPGSMQIAQAGAWNFNSGPVSRGFGNIQPIFYAHA